MSGDSCNEKLPWQSPGCRLILVKTDPRSPLWCRRTFVSRRESQGQILKCCSGKVRKPRCGTSLFCALEMKCPTCFYLSWGLLTVAVLPVTLGEMYTSLLNVKQAISVELKLIDYLRTYIDRELERLQDIRRWVTCMMKTEDFLREISTFPFAC